MSDSPPEASFVARTDAGLCGLWQPEHFEHVSTLDEWEDDVAAEDALEAHIRRGAFVPLNVGGDGCFGVTVREGGRTAREERYTFVSSDPYLLESHGTLQLGGLEEVGSYGGGAQPIACPAGRYSVKVHALDWSAEPGAVTADGRPTDTALPDFLVELHRGSHDSTGFRSSVHTFDRSQ